MELKENIRDAYRLVIQGGYTPAHPESNTMEIEVAV